jgi:hypothetical protein
MASLEGSLAGKPTNIAAFNRVTLAAKRGGVGTFFFCDVRDQIRRTHRLRRKSNDGVGSDTFQDRRTPNRSPRRLSVHLRAALSKIEFGWTPSGREKARYSAKPWRGISAGSKRALRDGTRKVRKAFGGSETSQMRFGPRAARPQAMPQLRHFNE